MGSINEGGVGGRVEKRERRKGKVLEDEKEALARSVHDSQLDAHGDELIHGLRIEWRKMLQSPRHPGNRPTTTPKAACFPCGWRREPHVTAAGPLLPLHVRAILKPHAGCVSYSV